MKTESNLLNATKNSIRGLRWAFGSERAFREEVYVLAVAIPAAFLLTPDFLQRALLIGSILVLMAVELLNTSIEKLCDHVTPELNGMIQVIKDMGSAAVFCGIATVAMIWVAVLAGRLGF